MGHIVLPYEAVTSMTSCVYGDCESSDDIRNRGRVMAETAKHLSEQLPDQWPGKANGNILCPAKTDLLKGVQKRERHLAAIHVLGQYIGHLLETYRRTQTIAAALYSCTSNDRINETLTKMHEEDLKWQENKIYNVNLSSEVVETMNARYIFRKIKRFGECLKKEENVALFYRCGKDVFKECGRNKHSKDKRRKKDKGRKRCKAEKDGKKNRKNRRKNKQCRQKKRKQKTK